jgi:hypothetical protein
MFKKKQKDNEFVAIGASLAGIYLVIVIMFLVFAKEQAVLLVNIAWAMVALGLGLGFFASRKK